MKYSRHLPAALVLACCVSSGAFAQSVPNGQTGPAPNAPDVIPDIAPPALPGAVGTPGIATAPKIAKANAGDPTTQLFTAINGGDYTSAQDAISRGADLTAQNSLAETPLQLSVALNQNAITFMILGVRNEGGGGAAPQAAMASARPALAKSHARPARAKPAPHPLDAAAPAPTPANNPGTPDPAAGFLGFGQRN